MGAARASTAGHWELAFSAMSEAKTACTIGRGMMGFAFFTTHPPPLKTLTNRIPAQRVRLSNMLVIHRKL
jgi:hypothetical protein